MSSYMPVFYVRRTGSGRWLVRSEQAYPDTRFATGREPDSQETWPAPDKEQAAETIWDPIPRQVEEPETLPVPAAEQLRALATGQPQRHVLQRIRHEWERQRSRWEQEWRRQWEEHQKRQAEAQRMIEDQLRSLSQGTKSPPDR